MTASASSSFLWIVTEHIRPNKSVTLVVTLPRLIEGAIQLSVQKQVYAFNVEANSLARGFPKDIRDVFPAVESGDHPDGNIDAAYFSYTHNTVFLLKGTSFWQVLGGRDRWRRPFLPRNGLLPHKEVDQQWFDICNVHPTALRLTRWGMLSLCVATRCHMCRLTLSTFL